jgi:hypothetical protein
VRSNASERVQNATVKVRGRESDLLITFYMLKGVNFTLLFTLTLLSESCLKKDTRLLL